LTFETSELWGGGEKVACARRPGSPYGLPRLRSSDSALSHSSRNPSGTFFLTAVPAHSEIVLLHSPAAAQEFL